MKVFVLCIGDSPDAVYVDFDKLVISMREKGYPYYNESKDIISFHESENSTGFFYYCMKVDYFQ